MRVRVNIRVRIINRVSVRGGAWGWPAVTLTARLNVSGR